MLPNPFAQYLQQQQAGNQNQQQQQTGLQNPTNPIGTTGQANVPTGNNPFAQYLAGKGIITAAPQQWNYKTAQSGPTGEKLPAGAVGWKPDGTPYFGPGFQGWVAEKKNMLVGERKAPTSAEWKDVFNRKVNVDENPLEAAKTTFGALSDLFGLIGRYQDTEYAQGSPLSFALRGTKTGLSVLFDAFQLGGIGVERGLGTGYNLLRGEDLGTAWQASRIFYTSVFNEAKRQEYIDRYQNGDEDPALLAMELGNPWAEMFGQMFLDPMNLIGVVSKAGKVSRVEREMTALLEGSGTLESAKAAKLIDDLSDMRNAERSAEKLADLPVEHMAAVRKIAAGDEQLYGLTKRIATGNREIMARRTADAIDSLSGTIMKNGGDGEDVTQMIRYVVESVSENADEVAHGIGGMLNAGRFQLPPKVLFSKPYIEMGLAVRTYLAGEKGAINYSRLLNSFSKVDNIEDVAKIAHDLAFRVAEKYYPTVKEMRDAAQAVKKAEKAGEIVSNSTRVLASKYEKLDQSVKTISAFMEKPGHYKDAINRFLGGFYFSQPSVASRNFMSDNVAILTDVGGGAYVQRGRIYSLKGMQKDLGDWFGFQPHATGGFTSAVEQEGKTFLNDLLGGKLMGRTEKASSTRVVWGAYNRDIKKLLGAVLSPAEAKMLGMDEGVAKVFTRLLYDTHGDVNKALDMLREAGKTGTIDSWRMLDYIPEVDLQKLDDLGMRSGLMELVNNPNTTRSDIEKFFEEANKFVDDSADLAKHDPIYIDPDSDMAKGFDLFDEAEIEGLDFQGRKDVLKAASQAHLEAEAALNKKMLDVYGTYANQLPANAPELQDMKNSLFRYQDSRKAMRSEVVDRVASVNEATYSIKREMGELSRAHTLDRKAFARMREELGIVEELPADLNYDTFREYIFRNRLETVGDLWNGYFESGYTEMAPIIDTLKGVDPTIADVFDRGQELAYRAQEMRTAIYSGNQLLVNKQQRIAQIMEQMKAAGANPKDILFKIASEYGIPTYSQGAKLDNRLLNILNKYLPESGVKSIEGGMDAAISKPRDMLPNEVSNALEIEARSMLDEISSAEPGTRGRGANQLGEGALVAHPSTYPDWYGEIAKKSGGRDAVINALEKIVKDKGSDKGRVVERLKEVGLGRIWEGDTKLGTPPDIRAMQAIGASEDEISRAMDAFENITGSPYTLGAGKFTSIDDAANRLEDAATSLSKHMGVPDESGVLRHAIPPPYAPSTEPTMARAFLESRAGYQKLFDNMETQILDRWGRKSAIRFSKDVEMKLQEFARTKMIRRVEEAKQIAMKSAEYWRDFSMHLYGDKTYFDVALSYFMPYHYWYGRTYLNWMKRIVTDPGVIAAYAKYRHAMEQSHAQAPEWWKYNARVNIKFNLLGMHVDQPLFFNLEANLNPLNGLTGVDFSDPYKRVDWLTRTLDDMGKFGPSTWAPLNMAIAASLQMRGEDEAASRWGGRLIPQTATLKSLLAIAGVKNPPELDPAVQWFSGGVDPYEAARVGRALGAMIGTNVGGTVVTSEMAIESARTRSGPLWDEARHRALDMNSPGQLMSSIAGVGFKARTEEDMMIDSFYAEYKQLRNMWDSLSADDKRMGMDALRTKYPFMDTVLLSRKGGAERDLAYAYNVISRIPPGQSDDIIKMVMGDNGNVLLQKFYETKGAPFEGWSEGDKQLFMGSIAHLGALMKIPDDATKMEWNIARERYGQFNNYLVNSYGENIQENISLYYDLLDKEDGSADFFLQQHPEIKQAMDAQSAFKVSDPMVYKYYGSLNSIFNYYQGQVYDQLERKYGNMTAIWEEYSRIQIENPKGARSFYNRYIKAYSQDKKVMMDEANRAAVALAEFLPENPNVNVIRPDFQPNGPIQEVLGQEIPQLNRTPTWEEISYILPGYMQTVVYSYWMNGETLSSAAKSELDYLAQNNGFANGNELLRAAGYALRR